MEYVIQCKLPNGTFRTLSCFPAADLETALRVAHQWKDSYVTNSNYGVYLLDESLDIRLYLI